MVANPEEFVNAVSTCSRVAGVDCWSPMITTLAPLINWLVDDLTLTFKFAGALVEFSISLSSLLPSFSE